MSRVVKKMAPPRPPPPSGGSSGTPPQQGQQGHGGGAVAPFQQQRNSQFTSDGQGQIDEGFRYRVGASVFYVKSELKHSGSVNYEEEKKIFSPPRPTAQSILTSSNKFNNNGTGGSTAGGHGPVKYFSQPTIINTSTAGTTGSSRQQNQQQQQASNKNYENVNKILLDWDEPPVIIKPPVVPVPSSTYQQNINIIKPTNKPQILGPKPTIIKPKPSFKTQSTQPSTTTIVKSTTTSSTFQKQQEEVEVFDEASRSFYDDDDSFISPPMPSMPPPPPPPDIEDQDSDFNQNYPETNAGTTGAGDGYSEAGNDFNRPYAIVLYDFQPEAEGDLSLQAGDLVYLTKSVDESWLVGICEGIEGMFPTNYVNVVVPLPLEPISYPSSTTDLNYLESIEQETKAEFVVEENINYNEYKHYSEVLYDFNAENDSDLSLKTGDIVTLRARIDEDWLWGELNGNFGQFPATFIQSVPNDIPYCQ